jgi:hypothetical protein
MRASRIAPLLAVLALASAHVLGQSKARPAQNLVVTCQNPLKPAEPIVLQIDERNAVVTGATKLFTFTESRIEWRDRIGYTYSLDRKDGLLHRVHPPTNTGYTFQCRETRDPGAPRRSQGAYNFALPALV